MDERNLMKSFLTIATGDVKYYKMALNLLKSYKLFNKEGAKFSIIADRKNEYTEQFDETIILDNPACSFMDKVNMLKDPVFDRNIFIDADCLVYGDIQYLWTLFPDSGISCFGRKFELNSDEGWFDSNNLGKYKDTVKSNIGMHGGIYYFSKDNKTADVYKTCLDIINSYEDYTFKYFSSPADEPVIALAMAINDIYPVDWDICNDRGVYLFYPYAKKIKCNVIKGKLSYLKDKHWYKDISILHFQNINTEKALYKSEVTRMNNSRLISSGEIVRYYFEDALLKMKIEYIPWILYEINTKILRKKS